MKVLHFYRTYYPDSFGGIEQVIRQMCVGSGRLGIDHTVLTLTRAKQDFSLEYEGHKIERVPLDFEIASTGFSARSIMRLSQLAREADLVHYHFPWPFMDLAHFLARVNKPSILTYHSDIVRQKNLMRLYQPLMRRFLGNVDRIIATSPNYMASSPVLAQYRDKAEVITYGLDKSIYPEPSAELMQKWRAECGERFFLFVGVLRYYKGLHILLEAAAGAPFPVVIVGAGPIEAELKEHAARLKLNNVRFVGAVPEEDKVALLKLCYALAFPSHLRSEAFGISLLEGAMYGKPMVSSEIGTGTSYINNHQETGLVAPPSDPQALRAAMQTLWDNPQMAQEMGRRAEQRYWQLFTADKMAERYVALYRQVLADHAGRGAAAGKPGLAQRS
ncbi:glycosyltransferase family 4 protein [Massilia sp. W12]|uniref:glycosyltransferase family 4 protein n=1 Tax=Massilia sp. W12 TaxID=3126507 RepID=UPI0030D173D8